LSNPKGDIPDLISKMLSPPIIATIVTVLFSLWSPIGSGLLNPPILMLVGFIFLAVLPIVPVIHFAKKGIVDIYVSKRGMRTPFLLAAIISERRVALLPRSWPLL